MEDSLAIWIPKLGFTNALYVLNSFYKNVPISDLLNIFRGPFQTTVDELTTGVLVRESDPLPEDITLSTEG